MTAIAEPKPTAFPITPDTPAGDYFRHVAASQPAVEALVTTRVRYTYADIDRWSDAIAADVVACNAPPDVPVAIVTRDNVALVPAAMGIVKAGHYFVTVDATDPDERVALVLAESKAALCLVDPLAPLPGPVRDLPHIELRGCPAGEVATPPARPASPWVHVCFTSGTTGKPKAIRTAHRRFVERTLAGAQRHGRAPGVRGLYTALPGYTRAPNNLFATLLAGGTMCAFDARNESLAALAGYIQRERIEMLNLTPALFRRLMVVAPPEVDFSSIRNLRIGADKVTLADIATFKARFPRTCTLYCGFASTEIGGGAFGMAVTHDTEIPGPLVPMGRKNPDVDVWLLDEEGNEVGPGEVGEIVVRSVDVVDGYWNDPELTAQRFSSDPADPERRTFRTGDLARCDENGLYYFVGRSDSRLKIYGRRIDPTEVEAAILATGPVREAVVVGKPDALGNPRLVAYVVMKPGETLDAREIRFRLREHVPAWMVPLRIFELETVPITRTGKVDRAALTALEEPAEEASDAAGDEMERTLLSIWSRVIGVPVRLDDDFFDDLGGESVIAAHLVTEVQRETGKAMPLSMLLELNTVAKMADFLRSATAPEKLAVLIQQGGPHPPLFCVAGRGGSVMRFRPFAAGLGSEQPVYGLTFHGFDLEAFPSSQTTVAACFADAVRGIQPEGPYYLAGYSGGARMALEIARLLRRQGETVALLGFFDAAGREQHASLARRFANRLDMLRQRPAERARAFLREATTRPVAWLKGRISQFKADREIGLPSRYNQINRAYSKIRRDFTAAPYDGPATLFRARNGFGFLATEPDAGWSAAGVQHLEIVDVEGDHVTLLSEHAESLGVTLRSVLERARREAAG